MLSAFPTFIWMVIYFCVFFRGRFCFFWVPDSMLSCCSAFLVFVFPASLLFMLLCFSALRVSFHFCFSAFPASLLFCFLLFLRFSAFLLFAFPASLRFMLLCFSTLPASLLFWFFLLLCLLLLLFYFFFSSVMCFCCSTSCSFAFVRPVFIASLFLFSSFALFSPVCILNETLKFKDPKWNPKKPKRNPDDKKPPTWNHKLTLKKT